MNPNSYTYNGVIVDYNDAQKAIVIADQNVIASLQQRIRDIQTDYNNLESQIQNAIAAVSENPHGACWYQNALKQWKASEPCYSQNNAFWASARQQQAAMQAEIDNINNTQLPQASKKLNDDIATIQNDIKLQIQTQLANTAANTQAAQSANLPAQSQLNAQQQLALIANQAAAAKLKQEETIKVVEFVLVAIVILGIAFLVIKKAS